MGILLDILIILIVVVSTIFGYKRGLVNVVFNFCACIISIILTFILYTPVTNFVINNTQIDDNIEVAIIQNDFINSNEYISGYISESMQEYTAELVARKLVGMCVSIALFVVIRLALILAKTLINGIASLPIIKQFNEVGGLAYGVLRGVFIIYVFLAILFLVVSMNTTGIIANAIDSSYISKFLYSNNIILNILF